MRALRLASPFIKVKHFLSTFDGNSGLRSSHDIRETSASLVYEPFLRSRGSSDSPLI